MRESGAAKVETNAGTIWCHLSRQGDTLKLRRYSEGMTFEIDADKVEIVDFVPLEDCKTFLKAESYSYKKIAVWTKILHMLEVGTARPTKASAKRSAEKRIVVPITELRIFYDALKTLDTATYVGLAEFYFKNPQSLERLWKNSRKTFISYKNEDGWTQGKRKELPSPPQRLKEVSSTNEFTAWLVKQDSEREHIGYTFVERELNPRTTRLGMFSNKLPATRSGTGGMDLLLRSSVGLPVVGEVKVQRDKNAFFALIQAMTYAVEMSTPNQLKRLNIWIKNRGECKFANHAVEIVILLVNAHHDDNTLTPVQGLIKILNTRNECEGLNHIGLLQNNEEGWSKHQ